MNRLLTYLVKFILLIMRTTMSFKLVMVRDDLCFLSDVRFTRPDVYGAITFLCTY